MPTDTGAEPGNSDQRAQVGQFVPDDFEVPLRLTTPEFVLEPLGPQHNDEDHRAWTSSIEHIRSTPGFEPGAETADPWPYPMSADDNLADLHMHADHFSRRVGFTYTVLSASSGEVVGCLYIYPDRDDPDVDAQVRSWVRSDHAELDKVLWSEVSRWLADSWPFANVHYASRS